MCVCICLYVHMHVCIFYFLFPFFPPFSSPLNFFLVFFLLPFHPYRLSISFFLLPPPPSHLHILFFSSFFNATSFMDLPWISFQEELERKVNSLSTSKDKYKHKWKETLSELEVCQNRDKVAELCMNYSELEGSGSLNLQIGRVKRDVKR